MSFFLQATLTNKSLFQAIKLNPNDAETYYQRAAMFKMVCSIIVFSRQHVWFGYFKSASCDGVNVIDYIIFKLITYCLRQHFITAR